MSKLLRACSFVKEDIPTAVLTEFSPDDVDNFTQAMRISGHHIARDLAAAFESYPTPSEASEYINNASQTLQDLYVADFEMARLKEIKEDRLLRLYLKIESIVPCDFMPAVAQGLKPISFLASWTPWLRYVKSCTIDSTLTLCGDPLMIITDPISFLILTVIIPIMACILFIVQLSLTTSKSVGPLKKYFKSVSDCYGGGLSIVNWDDPNMFDRAPSRVKKAKKTMGSPRAKSVTGGMGGSMVQSGLPLFDVDVAFTLLHMSSIMYERDTDLLGFATDLYDSAIIEMIRRGFPMPHTPFLLQNPEMAALRYTIVRCLFGADKRIIAQAKTWGLNFMAVSDLNGRQGPCGGLFWSEKPSSPFIVAAFKGTTPTNLSEWTVDATLEKCDARAYLHGSAHEGFYNSFFPTFTRLGLRFSPYGFMCAAIRTKVEEIKKKISLKPEYNGKIPLYVTGHSLGAALASIFYFRLRKGHDLDDVCDVRDAYVYGCPGTGDTEYAMGYANDTFAPYNSIQTLWRIINDMDMVARVPITPCTLFNGGAGDENDLLMAKGVIKSQSMLDYCVIGTGIRIFRNPLLHPEGYSIDVNTPDPIEGREFSAFARKASKTVLGRVAWRTIEWLQRFRHGNPAQRINLLIPFLVRDHLCTEYNASLEASEACLRAATTSKIKTSHLFTLKELPPGEEVNRRDEAKMPWGDDVSTADKDLAVLKVRHEGDIPQKPYPTEHDAMSGSDDKHAGDEDVANDVD